MITMIEKKIETVEDFADYANVTVQEAEMLLGYVQGHGYDLLLDENNTIQLLNVEEPENGIVVRLKDTFLDNR